MRSCLFVAAVVAGSTALPSRAVGWGKEGHEIVGRIADKNLSEKARAAVDALLKDDQFKSLSDGRLTNWADLIRNSAMYKRKFPTMGQWHYIDVDTKADLATLNPAAYCPTGGCALEAIGRFRAILKDPTKPLQDRREALFFIAHFVGDIHQPLHCAERDNDKGGNLVRVRLPSGERPGLNLHKVWDTELVLKAAGPLTVTDYAARLSNGVTADRRAAYGKGTVADWVIESHKLAREKVYQDKGVALPGPNGELYQLSGEYMGDRAVIVEGQLTKGGVRLAQVLNDVFKD